MRKSVHFLSSFWLKIIGFVTMAFDHVGTFMGMVYASSSLQGHIALIFRCIGRIALPIFIFLLVEGLRNSKKPEKYLFRIFIVWVSFFVAGLVVFAAAGFGLHIEFLDDLGGSLPANAFNDLMYVGLFLYLLNHKNKKLRFLSVLPLILIVASYSLDIVNELGFDKAWLYFPDFVRADYSIFALMLGIFFWYSKPLGDLIAKKTLMSDSDEGWVKEKRLGLSSLMNVLSIVLACIVLYLVSFVLGHHDPLHFDTVGSFAIISAFIIFLYNDKRGYDSKWFRWFSYLFYPVHIIIILGVMALLLM